MFHLFLPYWYKYLIFACFYTFSNVCLNLWFYFLDEKIVLVHLNKLFLIAWVNITIIGVFFWMRQKMLTNYKNKLLRLMVIKIVVTWWYKIKIAKT